jgi:hypothetical protein
MAADRRVAYDNSVFMIHNASMIVIGDSRVFQYWADDLKKTDAVIARAYANATGKTDQEILSLMAEGENNNGSYFYGKEIMDAGFATELIETEEDESKENSVKESKILYANFLKSAKAKEYDHDRIVALVHNQYEQNSREAENNRGEKTVKKEEVLKALSVFKENGDISLPEIAKHLNLSALVITDEQKANLSAYDSVKSLCGDSDPAEFISSMIEKEKVNVEAVRQAKLDEAFGPSFNPVNQVENSARAYAEMKLNGSELTDEKIAEVKEDKLFKKLAAEFADKDSEWNKVSEVISDKAEQVSGDAPVVSY